MIRDNYGIIVQPDLDSDGNIIVGDGKWDEGDSAFSTGMNSFGGSEEDIALMPLFIKDDQVVRHPYSEKNTGTAPHNDPKATSRDQVMAFFGGLVNVKRPTRMHAVCLKYAQSWRVNGDFLSPSDKYYLYKLSMNPAPLLLIPFAYLFQSVNLIVNCFINPKHEMTQATEQMWVYGKGWLWLLYKCHPDLFGNLEEYFCKWRKRVPIYVNVTNKVKERLNLK